MIRPDRGLDRLFDRYVVVDWSATNRPSTGRDSIWIADLRAAGEVEFSNPPTRHRAAVELDALVDGAGADRMLVAVDVALGYPRGSARHFGLDGVAPWTAIWQALEREIVDDERNRSNRFEVAAALNRRGRDGRRRRRAHRGDGEEAGPLWGRHRDDHLDGLAPTKPSSFPGLEYRACDAWLRAGGRRPASPWQLLGAGSVGSQSLTLIPILESLWRRCHAEVWPFTTGLRAPSASPGAVVIAEMWPTAFDVAMPVHWVRDAAQVHGVAHAIASADAGGDLAAWFAPDVAAGDASAVVDEEGWILGVAGNRIPPG